MKQSASNTNSLLVFVVSTNVMCCVWHQPKVCYLLKIGDVDKFGGYGVVTVDGPMAMGMEEMGMGWG